MNKPITELTTRKLERLYKQTVDDLGDNSREMARFSRLLHYGVELKREMERREKGGKPIAAEVAP